MNIIDINYKWNGKLTKRNSTKYIILHHRAGNGDAESIHNLHLSNGWSGIGYHFYVRKDGSVYRGRPVEMIGAHCQGQNNRSVGVCFEGDFEKDKMTDAQLSSGRELVNYLKNLYPKAEIKKHCELGQTACPGNNFPFEEIKKSGEVLTVDKAIEILKIKAGLQEETIQFLLYYKYGEELVIKLAKGM